MIVLAAADTLAGQASVASQVTSTIFGMELNGTTETYKVLDQRQLSNTAGTIYTVPSSTQAFIKSIHVVNNDTSARTFQYFRGGTAASNAITPAINLDASGGFAIFSEANGWTVYTPTGVVKSGAGGALLRVTNILNGTTSFTPGAGTRSLYVEMVGAGGQGGGVATAVTASGAGGGGGAGGFSAIYTSTIKTYTVAVGAGGSTSGTGATTGQVGGDTTFDSGSICTAKGGAGGIGDTIAAIHVGGLGGAGGLASSGLGDIKADGGSGGAGLALANAQAVSGNGGDSHFGAGANGRSTQGTGGAATVYGGGGAGGCAVSGGASVAGGAGGNGLIRVWEFA